MCAKWVHKLWMLSEKSKNFLRKKWEKSEWVKSERAKSEGAKSEGAKSEGAKSEWLKSEFPQITASSMELFLGRGAHVAHGHLCRIKTEHRVIIFALQIRIYCWHLRRKMVCQFKQQAETEKQIKCAYFQPGQVSWCIIPRMVEIRAMDEKHKKIPSWTGFLDFGSEWFWPVQYSQVTSFLVSTKRFPFTLRHSPSTPLF